MRGWAAYEVIVDGLSALRDVGGIGHAAAAASSATARATLALGQTFTVITLLVLVLLVLVGLPACVGSCSRLCLAVHWCSLPAVGVAVALW